MKEALSILSEMGSNDPNATLSQLGYTAATAQTKFPQYWVKWKEWNRADADFLRNNWFTAVANQLSWLWGGCNLYTGGMPGGIAQNGVPFRVNDQLRWPFGAFDGTGTFLGARFSTQIQPDHDRWTGDPKKRNCLVSASWYLDQSGIFAYHESGTVDAIRFYGDKRAPYNDASYESCGVVAFDGGEAFRIGLIKSDWFNTAGVKVERGTPCTIQYLSAFGNGKAGIWMVGTALATVTVAEMLTGDDNGAMILMEPGGGREAGGNVTIAQAKHESATIGEGRLHAHHKYTGHPFAILRGQFNFECGMLSYASGAVTSGQLFWVDDRLTNGTPQASRIECKGKGFGYAALLVDSRRGTYYPAPPDYSAWHMVYTTVDGVLKINDVVQTPKPFRVGGGPLGFVLPGQSFDFANATPQQPGAVVVPPACTWVLGTPGAWSTCVNRSQTRTTTYVPSIAGCVPATAKPSDRVETQACTTPGTGAVIATINNFSNANAGYKQTVDWKAVRTIELTAVKATSLASKFLFCSAAGARIVLSPDGAVWYGDSILLPAGTLQVGTAKDLVLNIPATDFTRIGDSNFTASVNGNAFVGSIAKIVVKQ